MKLISWNVNGLRAVVKKGFAESFAQLNADVIGLQEVRLQPGDMDVSFDGYESYWNYGQKKGYAGTAIFTKVAPLQVIYGIGHEAIDFEGRVIAAEFEDFWFVCTYVPNAQPELARIDFRVAFDDALREFLGNLEQGIVPDGFGENTSPKPVTCCGDFNVAHTEIDLKNAKPNEGKPGYSIPERDDFTKLLNAGFIDTYRHFYPDITGAYSWWSYRGNARANNTGWRIDYFVASESMEDNLEQAWIFNEIMGSDHCPVGIQVNFGD